MISSPASVPPAGSAVPTPSSLVGPVAAAAATLVLWASAFVAIRHLGASVSPGALSLGRLAVAAGALGALVGVRALRRQRLRWPRARDLWLVVVCGLSWFGIYNLSLNASEQRIDAATAALIVQLGPLVVAVLAALLLDEPLHRWLVIGMLIGFAGVVVIARASATHTHGDVFGVLLAVCAALTYAVGVLTQKPVLRHAGALELTFLACLIGALACLPWLGDLVSVVRTDGTSTAWLAYLGLGPTALAFSLWAYALARTSATAMATSTLLVPFLTAGIAWVTLGETPAALAFVGGCLCIAGVLVTRLRRG